MTAIIIAGRDSADLRTALQDAGATTVHVPAPVTGNALHEAGIDEAGLFVLTDHEEATAIPIVRERREDIPIVVYNEDGVPDFASHLADLIVDPGAIDRTVVVEELLDRLGSE